MKKSPKIINLKKSYLINYGSASINKISSDIFVYRYFSKCMACDFCKDQCCKYGVDVDLKNVGRIMLHADKMEKIMGIKRNFWFDKNIKEDKEFEGGFYTRTKKIKIDGVNACVFQSRKKRGCIIHKYCLENNLDYHLLKPVTSILFPLTFDGGLLYPSSEVMDGSLVCINRGPTLYEGVKNELRHYFGSEFVNELNNIKSNLQIRLK